MLREEQRAMPAYEEPPVLPGGSFLCKAGNMVLLGQHGERILSGKQLYHTHRAADFSMTVDMACFQRGTGFLRFSKVY